MLGNNSIKKQVIELREKVNVLESKCDKFISMIAGLSAELQSYKKDIKDATEDLYKNDNGLYDRRSLHIKTNKYMNEEEGND